jgi:glycosylphosphatidylinositol transamidase (GPIT) subunit GPI8
LIKKNGIPEDHIIVMAVDDLVKDEDNPFPG